jgi:cbb3-type cytochrome oxidase subunit 3
MIIIAIFILFILYWYFNIREQNIIQVDLPLEKMSNISIFDGDIL